MRSSTSDFLRVYVDSDSNGGISQASPRAAVEVRHGDESRAVAGVHVPAGEQVLSIEDLARRFNVSTKTISRWRDHGLVAQRYLVDGRRRVGFLSGTVERFIRENPMRIERGSRFSQLS